MNKNIVLIGMPGSGKSTIGCRLAKELNREFIDIDAYIESNESKSIKELFEISETLFRDVETKCAKTLSSLNCSVISTGGGIVKREENLTCFRDNSLIIFINRPIDCILQDIDTDTRPLLAEGREKLYALYNERIHLYKKYCDIEILNKGSISEALEEIIRRVELV